MNYENLGVLLMREHLRVSRIHQLDVKDPETGEITSEIKTDKIIAGNSGEFYQVFSEVVSILENVKPITAKIYISLFPYANRENIFALSKNLKTTIAEKNDVCLSSVNNAITNLVQSKLLIRVDRSTYRIHPRYFWKSSTNSRKQVLKYVLEIECPDYPSNENVKHTSVTMIPTQVTELIDFT